MVSRKTTPKSSTVIREDVRESFPPPDRPVSADEVSQLSSVPLRVASAFELEGFPAACIFEASLPLASLARRSSGPGPRVLFQSAAFPLRNEDSKQIVIERSLGH